MVHVCPSFEACQHDPQQNKGKLGHGVGMFCCTFCEKQNSALIRWLTTRRAWKLLPSCRAHCQPPAASSSALRSASPAPYRTVTPTVVHAARSLSRTYSQCPYRKLSAAQVRVLQDADATACCSRTGMTLRHAASHAADFAQGRL